jgi:LysM repeat protein
VPTFVGAAVACLSAQALAGAPAMAATAHDAAAVSPAHQSAQQHVLPVAAIDKAAIDKAAQQTKKSSGLLTHYTVRSGDTLSSIAKRYYNQADAWPVIFWANKHQIRWADSIQIGQRLRVPVKPSRIPSAPSATGPVAAPVAASVQQASAAPYQAPVAQAPVAQAPVAQAPVAQAPVAQAPVAHTAPAATYSGGSSFQQCVIARESGGNSQVMNGSGHYGLYQFSASTWAAYGGSPSTFGNASVAQQNQVFNNAIAAGGQSNWAPYDGC